MAWICFYPVALCCVCGYGEPQRRVKAPRTAQVGRFHLIGSPRGATSRIVAVTAVTSAFAPTIRSLSKREDGVGVVTQSRAKDQKAVRWHPCPETPFLVSARAQSSRMPLVQAHGNKNGYLSD